MSELEKAKPQLGLRFTKNFGFFDQRTTAHQWREWKAGDVADQKDIEWLIELGAPVERNDAQENGEPSK